MQAGQGRRQPCPVQRDEDDLRARGLFARARLDARTELTDETPKRAGAAAIGDGRLDAGAGERTREARADVAGADDADAHGGIPSGRNAIGPAVTAGRLRAARAYA